jgi:FeS assembly SUF system protein
MSSQPNNGQPRIIPLSDAPLAPGSGAPDQSEVGISENAAAPEAASAIATEGAFTRDPLNTLKYKPQIVEAISKVYDPEIPVNIYELGLVYDIDVDSAANAQIRMTLTAPACPSAQTIPLDVERRVREVAGLKDVKVDVVWDPPWTRDRMSEAAKLTLGMF